jgi:hypothetical protein
MSATTFILTSSPFLPSQVTLASFVPNISQPHQDAKRPYTVRDSDYSIQTDGLFAGQMDSSSKTFLDVLATKLASFSVAREKSNTLKLLAESGKIYTLNNPDDLFEAIVFGAETGPEVRRWLERCRLRRLAPRFVTAYRTFTDATISREEQHGTDVAGGVTAPVSASLGDPLRLADVEMRAGRHTSTGVSSSVETPGERIYAVCYRKIKIREVFGGGAGPSLDQTNKWKPFAAPSRGKVEEDAYLQAGLSEEDDGDVNELYEATSASRERVQFGVVSDFGSSNAIDDWDDFSESDF